MYIVYDVPWIISLNHYMELKIYGHAGQPVVVFPCQCGRFYEFEDFHMLDHIWPWIENGQIQLYTMDSLDNQTWANWGAHPAERACRHQDYDRYIATEVSEFIHQRTSYPGKWLTTGCSMGAYHAANFFFRHPDLFDATIAISGPLRLNLFVGDYMDDNVYFNAPLAFLPGLNDPWFIDQYRQSHIVVCVGQGAWEEPFVEDAYALQRVLEQKHIPAWIDLWGADVNHDWPWWYKMLPYHLGQMF